MEEILEIQWWGRCHYGVALEKQIAARDQVQREGNLGKLVFVEHPSVVTSGRNFPVPPELEAFLFSKGLPVHTTTRGGKLTYHGPGQLVIYPVVSLRKVGMGVKEFVETLSLGIGDWLAGEGVTVQWNHDAPGLWTDNPLARKIASVGLRIEKGVTTHGAAVNLSTDLTMFQHFSPCGFAGSVMTSLEAETGRNVPVEAAARGIADALVKRWGLKSTWNPLPPTSSLERDLGKHSV